MPSPQATSIPLAWTLTISPGSLGCPELVPVDGAAFQTLRTAFSSSVKATGHGSKARTRHAICSAVWCQSMRASSFLMRGAFVAWESSCGMGVSSLPAHLSSVCSTSAAPRRESLGERLAVVSFGAYRQGLHEKDRAGVPSPSSINIVVTPVSVSPSAMAH